eukprot:289860-Chlamydomonas_euryale.AAC.8
MPKAINASNTTAPRDHLYTCTAKACCALNKPTRENRTIAWRAVVLFAYEGMDEGMLPILFISKAAHLHPDAQKCAPLSTSAAGWYKIARFSRHASDGVSTLLTSVRACQQLSADPNCLPAVAVLLLIHEGKGGGAEGDGVLLDSWGATREKTRHVATVYCAFCELACMTAARLCSWRDASIPFTLSGRDKSVRCEG